MRRFSIFFLLTFVVLISGILMLGSDSGYASEPEPTPDLIPISPPAKPILYDWVNPAPLEAVTFPQTDSVNGILSVGGNTCDTAGEFIMTYDGETVPLEGSETDVSGFVSNPDDPVLSCNSLSSNGGKGYRSAWFQLTAPADGLMTVRSVTDQDHRRNYDTIIQIYSDLTDPNDDTADACAALIPIACNDDHYTFLSSTSTKVHDGMTYYIEVVDRNLASSGNVILNLEIEIEPDEGWQESDNAMPERVSRHAVVMVNNDAYVIGGQSTLGDAAVRSGDTYRYNTQTGTWTLLQEMGAGRTVDGTGYSNTDGVYVNGEIHFPTGFVGVEDNYDGTHWKYIIAQDRWDIVTDPILDWSSTPAGEPVAYTQVTPYSFTNQSGFYLVGGLTGKFLASDASQVGPTNMLYRYTISGGTAIWEPLAPMNLARYGHSAVSVGDLVCVVGGLTVENNANKIVPDGECYNRSNGTWSVDVTNLNIPRYLAGSAVGPDGRWYIFGGINASQGYIVETEVYDFTTETWEIMPNNYDIDDPSMAWLQGGFVGNQLFLFGGEQSGQRPVGTVLKKNFPFINTTFLDPDTNTPVAANLNYMPLVGEGSQSTAEDETLLTARGIGFGQSIHNNFTGLGDVYDLYTFTTGSIVNVDIDLDVPHGADLDLILYDANKNVMASSMNLGQQDEEIQGAINAGQYYILVARVATPPSLPPVDANYGLTLGNN